MKKISIILLAVVMAVLTSCNSTGNSISDASASDVASSVKEGVTFVDDMLEVKNEIAADFYSLPDNVTDLKVFMSSSGATAEELAVFKCDDEATVKAVIKACEKRIEDLNEKFEDYIPGELIKIENAVIEERDGFVMFICADVDHYDSAKESFEDYRYYKAD